MQVLLSRIEREYIIHSLRISRPDLNILVHGSFLRFHKTEYEINEDCIFLKTNTSNYEELHSQKNIKFFFTHKEIPFFFLADIKEKDDFLFVKINEKIYKNKDENEDKSFSFFLETANGFKMRASAISDFPLAFSENSGNNSNTLQNDDYQDKKDINHFKKEITKLRKSEKQDLPSAIFNRIQKIKNYKKKIKINTSMIFIDSNFILVFCTEKQAKIIASSISTRVEIALKERKIKASIYYDFFYSVSNRNIEFFTDTAKQLQSSISGILCLSIKKIHEEDKRFLYEYAYSDKYGLDK